MEARREGGVRKKDRGWQVGFSGLKKRCAAGHGGTPGEEKHICLSLPRGDSDPARQKEMIHIKNICREIEGNWLIA